MFRTKLGKILIYILSLVFIMGLIATMVHGQGNEDAISYLHVDLPKVVGFNTDIKINIGLKDKLGIPLLGKKFGNSETAGTWYIESLNDFYGKEVKFKVIDSMEIGKGNYQATIHITSWTDKASRGKYVLRVGYGSDYLSNERNTTSINKVYSESSFTIGKASIISKNFPPRVKLTNINPTRIYYVNSLSAGTTKTIYGSYEVLGSNIDVIQTSMDGINWRNAFINQKASTWFTDIILPSKEGKYQLYFRGRDKAGLYSSGLKRLNIVVDKTAPRKVIITRIEEFGEKKIKLHWKSVKDNLSGVDHYLVYRNNQLIRPYYLDDLRSKKNGFFYDNVAIDKYYPKESKLKILPNTSYAYKVQTVDKAGNISLASIISKVSALPTKTKNVSSLSLASYSTASYSIASLSQNSVNVNTFSSPHGDYETGFRTSFCAVCHNTHYSADKNLVKKSEAVLCLDCHNGNGSNYVISGYVAGAAHFDGADHDNGYSCKNCHNSHGTQYKGYLRFSAANKLCLSCHDGSSKADNIQNDLGKPYSHHTPSCAACHNSHMAKSTEPLLGVPGVSVNRTNSPAFTYKSMVIEEYELCYKCHSEYSRLVSEKDILPASDVAKDFNPMNGSYHAVEGPSKAEIISSLSFRGSDRKGNPWSNNSKIYCTDCHGASSTYPNEPKLKGVHGSTNNNILKGWYDTSKTLQNIKDDPDNFLCFRCHNPNEYIKTMINNVEGGSNFKAGTSNLHNNGNHEFPCWQCHGSRIHGKNREHLISLNQEDNTSLITSFTHADAGYYEKSNCTTTCHSNVIP